MVKSVYGYERLFFLNKWQNFLKYLIYYIYFSKNVNLSKIICNKKYLKNGKFNLNQTFLYSDAFDDIYFMIENLILFKWAIDIDKYTGKFSN